MEATTLANVTEAFRKNILLNQKKINRDALQ